MSEGVADGQGLGGASARPHRMADNRMAMFYAGGERIDRFRGLATPATGPEDWVASVTQLPGAAPGTGISWLPDGTSLRAAVDSDPVGWLGATLAARWGGSTGVLVKLLDAGERLPVHCHPSRPFAAEHLASPFGKTEGWIVLDDAAPDGEVWLGWSEEVAPERLRGWIEAQDADAMLAVMNRLPAGPGDVFLVPAGVPHAIGPGVMITELQEPTAFSILAEHGRFGLDATGATLGMGWETAHGAFDLSSWAGERAAGLRPRPAVLRDDADARVQRLFAESTGEFFQALRVRVFGRYELPPGFAVLVVESGAGELRCEADRRQVRKGETWVVPHDAGTLTISGDVRLLVCLPPEA
jgi:mannose-6-phosphate isomerase